jgi:hypothetical protein
MSKLRVNDDDHPDAAGKHLGDAQTLLAAQRLDGAAYLGGYVIECSLKTLILHDQSYDPALGQYDATKRDACHKRLAAKPYRHDIVNLMGAAVGPNGAGYQPRPNLLSAPARNWSEQWRYHGPGSVAANAHDLLSEATRIYQQVVVTMRQDGLL